MERLYQFPHNATHHYRFENDAAIKDHRVYRPAKAGDPEAAMKLVTDLAQEYLRSLKGQFPKNTKYAAPYASGAIGDNAIPLLLSIAAAQELMAVMKPTSCKCRESFTLVPTRWSD